MEEEFSKGGKNTSRALMSRLRRTSNFKIIFYHNKRTNKCTNMYKIGRSGGLVLVTFLGGTDHKGSLLSVLSKTWKIIVPFFQYSVKLGRSLLLSRNARILAAQKH